MPITSTPTYLLTVTSIVLDMINQQATVVLEGTIGGVFVNNVQFVIPPADLAGLILAQPTTGLTRQDDITGMIYEYAISKGYATGTIS